MPNITEILDQWEQSNFFSTLDSASGIHQIELDDKDRAKTAFSACGKKFQYKRMRFGLKNVPCTLQRLTNLVLAGVEGFKDLVYMDDIIVNDKTPHGRNYKCF